MNKSWYITGTDTGVGKTLAGCVLLQAAQRAGCAAVGYKPVASGCEAGAQGLTNEDALALRRYSALSLDYSAINPYALREATSPHIASARAGVEIDPRRLSEGLRALEARADRTLVEGAGGWFTPLGPRYSFADWVKSESLPVLMVVGIKLGCINHALLTALAVQQTGLTLAGWIANQIQPPDDFYAPYIATLRAALPAPCLGEIPWLPACDELQHTGDWLTLPKGFLD